MARILLVEDDSTVRLLWEHVLLDAGYEIDIAETGEAACGRIAAHAYDLVIADGLLADGTA